MAVSEFKPLRTRARMGLRGSRQIDPIASTPQAGLCRLSPRPLSLRGCPAVVLGLRVEAGYAPTSKSQPAPRAGGGRRGEPQAEIGEVAVSKSVVGELDVLTDMICLPTGLCHQ